MHRIARTIVIAASVAASGNAFALPFDDFPLPVVDVKLHEWGVEFIGSDGVVTDRDMWVVDPVTFDQTAEVAIFDDPQSTDPDIWDCIDAARAACPYGVKRFHFSPGPPAVCEFECFPAPGGGE